MAAGERPGGGARAIVAADVRDRSRALVLEMLRQRPLTPS
jgi:hypothetical protein